MDKIIIDIGFANLVVEQIDNSAVYPEVSAMLQDKETGAPIQDIAMVRPAVNEATGAMIPDAVDCFVWADANDDGFTDKFVIQKYKEDEACGSHSWLLDGWAAGINVISSSGKNFAAAAEMPAEPAICAATNSQFPSSDKLREFAVAASDEDFRTALYWLASNKEVVLSSELAQKTPDETYLCIADLYRGKVFHGMKACLECRELRLSTAWGINIYDWKTYGKTWFAFTRAVPQSSLSSAEAAIQIAASGRCCAICSVKCADKGEVTACTAFRWNGSTEADNGAHEGEHNG